MASAYSSALRYLTKSGYSKEERRAVMKQEGGVIKEAQRLGGWGKFEEARAAKQAEVEARRKAQAGESTVLYTQTPVTVGGASYVPKGEVMEVTRTVMVPQPQPQQRQQVPDKPELWGFRANAPSPERMQQLALSQTIQQPTPLHTGQTGVPSQFNKPIYTEPPEGPFYGGAETWPPKKPSEYPAPPPKESSWPVSVIKGEYKIGKALVTNPIFEIPSIVLEKQLHPERKIEVWANVKNEATNKAVNLAMDKDVRAAALFDIGVGVSFIPGVNILVAGAATLYAVREAVESPSRKSFIDLGLILAAPTAVKRTKAGVKTIGAEINKKFIWPAKLEKASVARTDKTFQWFGETEPKPRLVASSDNVKLYNVDFVLKKGQTTVTGNIAPDPYTYIAYSKNPKITSQLGRFETVEEATKFRGGREDINIVKYKETSILSESAPERAFGFGKFNPQAKEYIEANPLKPSTPTSEFKLKQTRLPETTWGRVIGKEPVSGFEVLSRESNADQIVFFNLKTGNVDKLPSLEFAKFSKGKLPLQTESGKMVGGTVFPFRTIPPQESLMLAKQRQLNPDISILKYKKQSNLEKYFPVPKEPKIKYVKSKTIYGISQKPSDTYNYKTAFDKLVNIWLRSEGSEVSAQPALISKKSKGQDYSSGRSFVKVLPKPLIYEEQQLMPTVQDVITMRGAPSIEKVSKDFGGMRMPSVPQRPSVLFLPLYKLKGRTEPSPRVATPLKLGTILKPTTRLVQPQSNKLQFKQIQRVQQIPQIRQTPYLIPRVVQRVAQRQEQRVLQLQLQKQLQIQRQMERRTSQRPRTTPRPKPEPPGEPPPPRFDFDFDLGKKKKVKGFGVAFKRRGKFKEITSRPLSFEAAMSLGARKVGATASATFKVFPKQEYVEPSQLKDDTYFRRVANRFYPKETKQGQVYIQRSRFRISSPGELREITFAPRYKKGGLLI